MRNTLPINIATTSAKTLLIDEPLEWHGFEHRPIEMFYENTGCDGNVLNLQPLKCSENCAICIVLIFAVFSFYITICGCETAASVYVCACVCTMFGAVRMTASFKIGEIPFVRGAGLRGNYIFVAIRFLCLSMQIQNGICNTTSAYHLIDGGHFPLEIQLFAENESEKLRISYFFTRQTHKNFSLEPLMNHLDAVKSIKSFKCSGTTFCLDQIIPKIAAGFYVYDKFVTIDGQRIMMRCIVEANALIPIGETQLQRLQKIQQNLIMVDEDGDNNPIHLRQYLRQRRCGRLADRCILRDR